MFDLEALAAFEAELCRLEDTAPAPAPVDDEDE
jgi:hypothetical protein